MPKHLDLKSIGEYYNTAHLVRPIQPRIVSEYAALMKTGNEFPPVRLGIYPTQEGGQGKLIVDGVHVYRAGQLAKLEKMSVDIQEYASLSDALAEQLRSNIAHGVRLTATQRDIRIRMLAEVYNWPVRRIAAAIGLHFSSVSRITRKKQNVSGTGKGGPRGRRGAVVAHALPIPVFFRTIQNVHLTLGKPQYRTLILAAIHDPKKAPELPRMIALLTQVASEMNQLLKMATESVAEAEATEAVAK